MWPDAGKGPSSFLRPPQEQVRLADWGNHVHVFAVTRPSIPLLGRLSLEDMMFHRAEQPWSVPAHRVDLQASTRTSVRRRRMVSRSCCSVERFNAASDCVCWLQLTLDLLVGLWSCLMLVCGGDDSAGFMCCAPAPSCWVCRSGSFISCLFYVAQNPAKKTTALLGTKKWCRIQLQRVWTIAKIKCLLSVLVGQAVGNVPAAKHESEETSQWRHSSCPFGH